MKPRSGVAHPSLKTCTHCKSNLLMFNLGRVAASLSASSSLLCETNSSKTLGWLLLTKSGKIP